MIRFVRIPALIAILIIVVCNAVSAQELFESGTIITHSGDTVAGSIDFGNWDKNPDHITFKESEQGESQLLSVEDIDQFSVSGLIYVAVEVDILTSSTKPDKLEDNREPKTVSKRVFILYLIGGDKGLLSYKNEGGVESYYIKNDSSYHLLTYKKYYEMKDGKKVMLENTGYLNQLSLFLKDCPSIYSKLPQVSYDQKNLVKLFNKYYECMPFEVNYQLKHKTVRYDFGINLGVSISTLKFKSDTYYNKLKSADFDYSTNLSLGLYSEIFPATKHQRASLYNEILYTGYNITGEYVQSANGEDHDIYIYNFNNHYLQWNIMFRYRVKMTKFDIFFNAGFSNGFMISDDISAQRELQTGTTIFISPTSLFSIRKYEQGVIFGLGGAIKKFAIDLRYERGTGFSSIEILKSSTDRYFILVGYRFN